MWRLLPGLLLAALLTSGRASAQAWSMPGLNDLPALPGVAKDIMHSITSGATHTRLMRSQLAGARSGAYGEEVGASLDEASAA